MKQTKLVKVNLFLNHFLTKACRWEHHPLCHQECRGGGLSLKNFFLSLQALNQALEFPEVCSLQTPA